MFSQWIVIFPDNSFAFTVSYFNGGYRYVCCDFFAPSSVWAFLGGLPIFSMPQWNLSLPVRWISILCLKVSSGTTHWLTLEPSWVSTFSVARALALELSTVVIIPLGVFSLRGCGKPRQQPAVWHLTSPGSPLGCPRCGSGRGTESHMPLVPWPNFCLFLRAQPNSNLCLLLPNTGLSFWWKEKRRMDYSHQTSLVPCGKDKYISK